MAQTEANRQSGNDRILNWIAERQASALRFLSASDLSAKLTAPSKEELTDIIAALLSEDLPDPIFKALGEAAHDVRRAAYGDRVFFRGLIEFTNYCKNGCYYCGINAKAKDVRRYRLSEEEILACCANGKKLGYHSFVLQGGEDPYFTDDRLVQIIRHIREDFPDSAITLSIGEKSHDSYVRYFEAGADRYLLRHETANEEHYARLHPSAMKLSERKACLYDLSAIGYQVGAGFMVGSPYQTAETLAEDLVFLTDLQPHMVGIGPFIPSAGTIFADRRPGTVRETLIMLAVTRLLLPRVLLPSTTALGTIDPLGREKGFGYGANVVMPNLSPLTVRSDYALYDNKICTGDDAASCQVCLNRRILSSGNVPDYTRGDHSAYPGKSAFRGHVKETIKGDRDGLTEDSL